MENQPKQIWFTAKTYGWGWQPSTWQGFVTLGVYLALECGLVVLTNLRGESTNAVVEFFIYSLVLTTALIVICYKKGERPHWSWGKK